MLLHIREAKHLHDYVIWFRFNDGAEGEFDFKDQLWGEVFEPLKKIENFVKFHVDPDMETIVWHNGADFAPEFIYERMNVLA
jgi:hypothetical protein